MAPGLKYLFIDCIRSSHQDIIISTHAPGQAAKIWTPPRGTSAKYTLLRRSHRRTFPRLECDARCHPRLFLRDASSCAFFAKRVSRSHIMGHHSSDCAARVRNRL